MPKDAQRFVRSRRGLLVATMAMAVCLEWLRFSAPRAKVDAAVQAFAAGRAAASLRKVLAEEVPHPRGSDANRRVRGRIEAALRELGIEPRVEQSSGCVGARCAAVENIVATIPGTGSHDEAILLACHYDSVPRGPGASDDGAGIATLLEVARALVQGGPSERDVVLLFDDGEEQGLLGADAFVKTSREISRIRAVLNVEARGTKGPSLLFETKHVGFRGIRAMARALPRPVTSSLFAAVYERMPNGTDLTVFGEAGLPGFNFAFIRGAEHYHRATDDLAHLSLESLQHHGEHVLALTRVLGAKETDVALREGEPRAVWFDVLSLAVLAWPEPWSPWLALAEVVLLAVAVRRSVAYARPAFVLALVGLGLALGFAPASYLLVAPMAIAAVGLVLVAWMDAERARRASTPVMVATIVLASAVWAEVLLGLRDAFG